MAQETRPWGPIATRLWGMPKYYGTLVGPRECYVVDNYTYVNPFGVTY